VPRNGIDQTMRLYRPKAGLELKDWTMMRMLIPDRLVTSGYMSSCDRLPVWKRSAFFFLIVLPTAVECALLRAMVSPRYWSEVVSIIKGDQQAHGHVTKGLLRNIRLLNPVNWIYYMMKRIAAYIRFAWMTREVKICKVL